MRYTYTVANLWPTDRANDNRVDLPQLGTLIDDMAAEGWELVEVVNVRGGGSTWPAQLLHYFRKPLEA